MINGIQFKKSLVVDHPARLAAGELTPDDAAGVTEDGPGALVGQASRREAVPCAFP